MNIFLGCLATSLGLLSSIASAEVLLKIEGKEYKLSVLMENCQTMGDNPTAQVACFNAVSTLLEQQSGEAQTSSNVSAPEALEALRNVAQHEGADSGLIIQGTGCNAQILYYANYFHVSRRNMSTIDLFSAQFDMSKFAFDKAVQATGGRAHMSKGAMQPGAVAATIGAEAISSAQYNIAAKSARASIAEYAMEVAVQLKPSERSEFDFVLVHPAKQQSSTDIWNAFEAYAGACQS